VTAATGESGLVRFSGGAASAPAERKALRDQETTDANPPYGAIFCINAISGCTSGGG